MVEPRNSARSLSRVTQRHQKQEGDGIATSQQRQGVVQAGLHRAHRNFQATGDLLQTHFVADSQAIVGGGTRRSGLVTRQALVLATPLLPQEVDTAVAGHRVEPGAECSIELEIGKLATEKREDFLHHVGGIVGVSGEATGEVKDEAAMAFVETGKRGLAASRSALSPFSATLAPLVCAAICPLRLKSSVWF